MHHLYPSLKGDQLCPLGFHPQTRYPTRCKRCFRDYKEHGGRRNGEDVISSSPNLSDAFNSRPSSRTWTSTQNLVSSNANTNGNSNDIELKKRPLSWASTPNVADSNKKVEESSKTRGNDNDSGETNVDVVIKLPVPTRRHTLDLKKIEDAAEKSKTPQPKPPKPVKTIPEELVILSTDSLAERARKMALLKQQRNSTSKERLTANKSVKEHGDESSSDSANLKKPPKKVSINTEDSFSKPLPNNYNNNNIEKEKAYISRTEQNTSSKIFEKQKSLDYKTITSISDTNDKKNNNTLDQYLNDIKTLRLELDAMKARAEKAEREKSDILLRRLASMDTASNRTAASEALVLQQKVNELKDQLDKTNEEKRKLNTRMKDLEKKGIEYELKKKLQAAEQLCEELMEENQDAKKEIINMQAEMDELQDTYRDDDVKAKTNLQKDLEKSTKNCRVLSFKLRKYEKRIESLEQERKSNWNEELLMKIKTLEDELHISNELTKRLQVEAKEYQLQDKKKPPMLGSIGKSTSADAKVTRASLTRGDSQEDSKQIMRDLQDSIERESDLKEQLKFSEEEAEILRKKVARFEDENDSLMMQLKKMATRSRTSKLDPIRRVLRNDQAERDEGISDEDDPTELRILLELNEQEASLLRNKVDNLERENFDMKKQLKEVRETSSALSLEKTATNSNEKRLKALNDELTQIRKSVKEKDQMIEKLKVELSTKSGLSTSINKNSDMKNQLDLASKEVNALKTKITTFENENTKLNKDNKQLKAQNVDFSKLTESFANIEKERNELKSKLQFILQESSVKLPPRIPKHVTELTPKSHLKNWVEELENEIAEMRILVENCGARKLKVVEDEKKILEEDLKKLKEELYSAMAKNQKLQSLESSIEHYKKSEEELTNLNVKMKSLEEKIKAKESQLKLMESQTKKYKSKITDLEKNIDQQKNNNKTLESKVLQIESEMVSSQELSEKEKKMLQKEISDLKTKSSSYQMDSKQSYDLKNQIEDLKLSLSKEEKRYSDLNLKWQKMSEETVLMRAKLTTENKNLQTDLYSLQQKITVLESIRSEKTELAAKLSEANKKIQDLTTKTMKSTPLEYEKEMLKNKLAEKEHEYNRLRRENEMNIDLVFQLRKENDDLTQKLSDFNRIEQAQSSISGYNTSLENEIKSLKVKMQGAEIQSKTDVASIRLRYENQVKNLNVELTALQRQCEKFKKDRDTLKEMLEAAQKKIGDLKSNTSGRQSRNSMQSSDEDDKNKINYLEKQISGMEDQLVEARLELSKVKTELVSERSANEIKISEMQSKLNEYEEDRVIGSGRTKIPGMKTRLELSWQKEREDQQRLLQETSTLARDLRQTLFEVERERDKERLESKRRLDQIKRSTEEEMEEGRKKIAELQCDLLDLRDVHAKLRTSNEKLRRERERYEKETVKKQVDQETGDRKIRTLLQVVDELQQILPKPKSSSTFVSQSGSLQPEQRSNSRQSRSPSPSVSSTTLVNVFGRLTEATEDFKKFQEENERIRIKRGSLRRATSQETDTHGSSGSISSLSYAQKSALRSSRSQSGNSFRKSLSLDQTNQQDQNIWRLDNGSQSSMQSIDSELGFGNDSKFDSRLSGESVQSDITRGPRKKKRSLIGKLRSLTKNGRNSESELSIQGSDSDLSVASDVRSSKKDLRGRLSGMFKRSSSTSRSASMERASSEQRPVAVTVVGDRDGPKPREPPPANSLTPKPIRSKSKPPTPVTSKR